jgi:hypothetical protein
MLYVSLGTLFLTRMRFHPLSKVTVFVGWIYWHPRISCYHIYILILKTMYSIHDMRGFCQYHISWSLDPAADPCQQPYESTTYSLNYLKVHFNSILPLIPRFLNRYLLLSKFSDLQYVEVYPLNFSPLPPASIRSS